MFEPSQVSPSLSFALACIMASLSGGRESKDTMPGTVDEVYKTFATESKLEARLARIARHDYRGDFVPEDQQMAEFWDWCREQNGNRNFKRLANTLGNEAAQKVIAQRRDEISEQAARKFQRSDLFQETIQMAVTKAMAKAKVKAREQRISKMCTNIKKELKCPNGDDEAMISKFGLRQFKSQMDNSALPERRLKLVGNPHDFG